MRIRREKSARFWQSENGSIAVNFGLGCALLLMGVSVALTTESLIRAKNTLQHAADMAVLAATVPTEMTIKERKKLGRRSFDDNIGKLAPDITKRKIKVVGNLPNDQGPELILTATMTASATVDNILAFAIPKVSQVNVTAEAMTSYGEQGDPPFVNIYIIVDNSASMGIGQTKTDRDAMVYDTEIMDDTGMEPCAFACHSGSENSYTYYKDKGIRLRIDAVSDALKGFVGQALAEEDGITKNTRISIIPLDKSHKSNPYNFAADLTAAYNKSENIKLTSGEGLTDLQTPLDTVNSKIENIGDGSSEESPLNYVILMTDGLEHFNDPSGSSKPFPKLSSDTYEDPTIDGTYMQTLETRHCDALKTRGINLIVMNIEYGFPDLIWDWPVKDWYKINYKPDLDQLKIVNDLVPEIPMTLRDCASSNNNYYDVDSEGDMETAFETIFGEITGSGSEQIYTRIVK